MGSFIGHAIPGSFFFMFGLWWVIMTFRRHFLCRQIRKPFYASATFPVSLGLPFCPKGRGRLADFPVESVVKMVLCGLGIVAEIIGGTNHISHRFDSIGNTQHITMYFFFALTGVLDILVHKDVAPVAADYAGLMLALLVEGALFKFHLFGRDQLDVLLHTLLLYTIGFTVILVGMEAAYRKAPILPLLRGLLLMVQGTWFWAVAFILYNPNPSATPWDPENHHHLMLAVVCFSWHVGVNLLLVLGVGGLTACCWRRRGAGGGLWGNLMGGVEYSQLSTVPLDVLSGKEEEVGLLGGGKGGGDKIVGGGGGGGGGSVVVNGGGGGGYGVLVQDDDLSDLEFEAPVLLTSSS